MSPVHNIPPVMEPVLPNEPPPKRTALWYSLMFAAVQLAALVGSLYCSKTQWLLKHDDYPGLQTMGYSSVASRCEVVIYGDSTALTGLDPAIIGHVTGLKTCNLSEVRPVQLVMGSDAPLNRYLEHNPAPRFLIADYSAMAFQPEMAPFSHYYVEGMMYGMQYGGASWFKTVVRQHPWWVVKFSIWSAGEILRSLPAAMAHRGADLNRERERRVEQAGFWQFPLPPENKCTHADEYPDMDQKFNRNSTEAFKKRYSGLGIQVLIDVSPAAACDPMLSTEYRATDGLSDNILQILPVSDFNEEDVHFSPEGSRVFSLSVAEQILSLMKGGGGEKRPSLSDTEGVKESESR